MLTQRASVIEFPDAVRAGIWLLSCIGPLVSACFHYVQMPCLIWGQTNGFCPDFFLKSRRYLYCMSYHISNMQISFLLCGSSRVSYFSNMCKCHVKIWAGKWLLSSVDSFILYQTSYHILRRDMVSLQCGLFHASSSDYYCYMSCQI